MCSFSCYQYRSRNTQSQFFLSYLSLQTNYSQMLLARLIVMLCLCADELDYKKRKKKIATTTNETNDRYGMACRIKSLCWTWIEMNHLYRTICMRLLLSSMNVRSDMKCTYIYIRHHFKNNASAYTMTMAEKQVHVFASQLQVFSITCPFGCCCMRSFYIHIALAFIIIIDVNDWLSFERDIPQKTEVMELTERRH